MSVIIPGVAAAGSIVTAQLANDSVNATKIDFGTGSNQVDTDVLPEGSTNLYHTNERVDDRVNALLTAGANITLTYDDAANTLTIAATEDNLSNNDTDDLSEGSSNLYFTNARASTAVLNTSHTGNITLGSNGNVQFESGIDAGEFIYNKSKDNYLGIDSAYLFIDTDSNAVKLSVGGSGNPAKLEIQEEVIVDTDITIGNWDYRNNSSFPVTGVKVTSPENKVKWAMINLEEFGGDLADADDKPFNINNPTIAGVVHGGTQASPTAVGSGIRTMVMAGSPRYGTSSGDIDTTAQINFFTTETQSSTNRGSEMLFKITPTTRTGMEDWMKVNATALTSLNIAYDPSGSFATTILSTQSTNGFQVDDNVKVAANLEVTGAQIDFTNLPTSDPGVAGRLYRDGATVKVSI